jgi:hypothetical protein
MRNVQQLLVVVVLACVFSAPVRAADGVIVCGIVDPQPSPTPMAQQAAAGGNAVEIIEAGVGEQTGILTVVFDALSGLVQGVMVVS